MDFNREVVPALLLCIWFLENRAVINLHMYTQLTILPLTGKHEMNSIVWSQGSRCREEKMPRAELLKSPRLSRYHQAAPSALLGGCVCVCVRAHVCVCVGVSVTDASA